MISIVMPLYNGQEHLREAVESILCQTETDWELIVVNEYGSSFECTEMIREYAFRDERIKLIQNKEKLGLAESLNYGIQRAAGRYIARMDADDISEPDRLKIEKQFLDTHPDVILCGTWQKHFNQWTTTIHCPPIDPDQCRANLLFFCDLCHSTIMFRRKPFLDNNLFYDPRYGAEDFELWTRVLDVGEIATIPAVLGEYRLDERSKTAESIKELQEESGKIVAKTINKNLQFDLPEELQWMMQNWKNPFLDIPKGRERKQAYVLLEKVLRKIYEANRECGYYDEASLLRAIRAKWYWAKYRRPFNEMKDVRSIDSIFAFHLESAFINRVRAFFSNNKGTSAKIHKIKSKIEKM